MSESEYQRCLHESGKCDSQYCQYCDEFAHDVVNAIEPHLQKLAKELCDKAPQNPKNLSK